MQGVLITNGGPHPADKWAEATASHIVDIADHVAGEKRGAAVKLQAAIIDILEAAHGDVQTGEREAIKAHGHDRLQHPVNPGDHVDIDATVQQIIAAASGTPWQADFTAPEMADHLKALLMSHFATNLHIERAWDADRHPDTPQAQAFKAAHHPGEGA